MLFWTEIITWFLLFSTLSTKVHILVQFVIALIAVFSFSHNFWWDLSSTGHEVIRIILHIWAIGRRKKNKLYRNNKDFFFAILIYVHRENSWSEQQREICSLFSVVSVHYIQRSWNTDVPFIIWHANHRRPSHKSYIFFHYFIIAASELLLWFRSGSNAASCRCKKERCDVDISFSRFV